MITKKDKPPVPKKHYYHNYDNVERFVSYFNQADLIKKRNPKKVLEVGIGNKTLNAYLKNIGIDIVGCDIDKNLGPDIIGDIRNLPFKDNSFDVVVAFEVLEHIPFEDFERSIKELKRVSKKYVILSVPYPFLYFVSLTSIVSPFFQKRFHHPIRFPLFFKRFKKNNEHYWEMGYKNYSKRVIKKILLKHFKIKEELNHPFNPYHYFFVLEK